MEYISSPLNYIGNKYKLLNEIIPEIPTETQHIVEIFSGSAMVSINSECVNITLNDTSKCLIELLEYFYKNDYKHIEENVEKIIEKYNFTNTYKYGYSKYPTTKNEGLSRYNKEPYLALRKDYNEKPTVEKLFVLILFGFNHFIRFNSKGEFNVPVGKVDFSKTARNKTENFIKRLKEKNIIFYNKDFREEELYKYDKNTLFYFDPPYLITEAPYNNIWNEETEKDLLKIIDNLHNNGYKFLLSNVFESNGKENTILKNWSNKYKVLYLNKNYDTANYRRKNNGKTVEVLIKNY